MRNLLIAALLMSTFFAAAQTEEITVMQYNLTYYGNTGGSFIGCDNSNNSTANKNIYLDTIISEVKPDIFGVNELGYNLQLANSILNNALNSNGRNYYDKSMINGYGDITNLLYYNKNKFGMYSEDFIDKDLNGNWLVRYIDIHTLYFKSADLASTKDTVYLTFIVAHLKAGSSATNQSDRDKATAALMSYLENNNVKGYKFFMGDFNIQSSNENAFQNLINYSNSDYNFIDPINQLGTWNNSSAYTNIHTQSTRSSDDNGGCFVAGGLDDRFDFILCDNRIENVNSRVRYVNGSYKAVGNDGGAFNSDLRISNNSVVSSTLAQALYNMSDHLPVTMKLELDATTGISDFQNNIAVSYANPLGETISVSSKTPVSVDIYNISGQFIISEQVINKSSIQTQNLKPGIYIMKIQNQEGDMMIKKLVK